jgi:hypothetical protein
MRPFEQLESSIYKFGWLQGSGKRLKEGTFWLRRPDLFTRQKASCSFGWKRKLYLPNTPLKEMDEAIDQAATQIRALGNLDWVVEKPMVSGVGIHYGSEPTNAR